ncbi:uncharacterized protein LOC113793637 [Dermatophagoides pteronyssinus]|uniref:uncharacterized protein LOC113793637 n=1 Tax=Dermatophagoides pteronyssinus TaxID=6956 RepID=UPI003F6755D9
MTISFKIFSILLIILTAIISIHANNVSIDNPVNNQEQKIATFRNHFKPSLVNEKIDKEEYDNFRNGLMLMRQNRQRNMDRLNDYYQRLLRKGASNIDFTFRAYNFTTGIQFEEEFDCDLHLLTDCESSLLRKIEIIEGRFVVFTVNRTEEEEVSSQIDVLNVCRSLDKEFTCLINFADKCEKRMTWSSFSILKYVITQNNETIVSCKQKEIDWLGPSNDENVKENVWIDQNGMSHLISNSRGPCIPTQVISICWTTNMGQDFQFGHDEIQTGNQCESVYHFERCLKKYLYEEDSECSLDEKEATVQIILGTIKWNLSQQKHLPKICYELKHQWIRKKHIIGMQENIYNDYWDRAKRFAFNLRTDFGSLLDPYCNWVVKKFDKPCERRFDRRIRQLWHEEDVNGVQLDWQRESETICCAISEFKQCVSIYVLIRCGKDSFRYFNNHSKIAQLNQCNNLDYSTEICSMRLNF